jgi:hypothetical protein
MFSTGGHIGTSSGELLSPVGFDQFTCKVFILATVSSTLTMQTTSKILMSTAWSMITTQATTESSTVWSSTDSRSSKPNVNDGKPRFK